MADLNEAQIADAVTQAANAWSETNPFLTSCTDLQLSVTMKTSADAPPNAVYDHANNVVFRDAGWCPDPNDPNCKDPHALAITSVFAARTSGEIVDADIEVNTMVFNWGDLVTTPSVGGRQDLQNALTHEMGHLVGFDHSCYDPLTSPTRPADQNGDLVPDCLGDNVPDAVRLTTMFASSDPGDVSKRTLEADDLQAVCDAYPRGKPDPLLCGGSDDGGGCAIADVEGGGRPASWPIWAAAIGLLALLTSASVRRVRARARSRQLRL